MLILIDIGNTNIVVGVGDPQEERLICSWRLASSPSRTEDEYFVSIRTLLAELAPESWPRSGAVISSVVPNLTPEFISIVRRLTGNQPLVVGPGIRTGLDIAYHDPSEVGADRIANAVAARRLYGTPIVVVDFGTATTFDLVLPPNIYAGGAIVPGVGVSLSALIARTAQLPRVELKRPRRVVGKSPTESIQSGVFWGTVAMVEGMIERLEKEVGTTLRVIATGGLGALFAQSIPRIEAYEPDLTLRGLMLLHQLNQPPA